MSQKIMVFGIYSARASAETAADALVSAGFSSSDICALLPGNITGTHTETEPEEKSHAPVGRRVTSARGVFSGTLDVLVGLGMLAIPGLGPMVGESTLKAGLACLGVDGAVGDVAKALINMRVPELEAKRYEDRLERGAILLAMRCNSDVISYVKAILKRTGAEDICAAPAPSAETRSSVSIPAHKTAHR
jgi:hypothetical protein